MIPDIQNFIKTMPKIELHVHLEGSVAPATLLALARKNSINLPAVTLDEIREWYVFKNFGKFIEVYRKISECIQSTDDLELITRNFLKNQKAQNIIYTEFTYTPFTHYRQKGLSFADQLTALEKGRKWGLSELDIDCRFIMDIDRMLESAEGQRTAQWLLENKNSSIVALGLGGAEEGFPPERHREAFSLIKETRFHSVPHAGEHGGPGSIWGAIKFLNAERLGHGVRSWEDPELIEYLVKKGITLEVCPTSNICLNVFDSMKNHVLPKLVDAGVKVTINSDDPPMFNANLTREYEVIARTFGYTDKEFLKFNLTAIENCFLGAEEKKELEKRYKTEWKQLISKY